MDKLITSVNISQEDIAKQGESRQLNISGTNGARFILQVVNSEGKFYNFTTSTFTETAHTPQNNLKRAIRGSKFSTNIQFPSVSSAKTYNVIVIADATTDTVNESPGGVSNISISQVVDTTITFGLLTANTGKYSTTMSSLNVATVGSPLQKNKSTVNFSGSVDAAITTGNGYGLILSRQPVDTDLVFRKTATLSATTSSSTSLIVTDSADLAPGMFLISGPNLSGTPYIVSVKGTSIVLSTAQTLNNTGTPLVFEARGSKSIFNATKVLISLDLLNPFTALVPKDGNVTSTVRAGGSGVTINLNGTHGISGGEVVTLDGLNVDNTSTNRVATVTDNGTSNVTTSGSIDVEVSQTLSVGTELFFKGSSTKIDINGKFGISNFGSTDRTISLNLDNFITPGTNT